MKVVWVVRPAEGGLLQHVQQLSEGMSEFEIVVVGPPELECWGGKHRFIPLKIADGLRPGEDLSAVFRLRRILRTEKAPIIHAHGLKAAILTAPALSHLGPHRFIFTAHNSLPEFPHRPQRWWARKLQRRLFRRMDMIISVSNAVRQQIVNLAPEARVMTIHNGISAAAYGQVSPEDARREAGLSAGDRVVGTVARLIPSKGIKTLLEAVSLVAKILPDLKLVIVGDGPERERLERYAQGLGLREQVRFLGQREDVPSLMAGWDCFALPSLSEGFNLSVLEAMASRLPVVVSDLPALREAVVAEKGGFLASPGSAPDFAAALLYILKAPEKAKAMGEFNRERVNAVFDVSKMIRSVHSLYKGYGE